MNIAASCEAATGKDTPRLEGCPILANLSPEVLHELGLSIATVSAGADLACQGLAPDLVRFVLTGWIYRHGTTGDGRRHILGFMFAGDIGSSWTSMDAPLDHGVRALTSATMAVVSRERMERLVRDDRDVAGRLRRAEQMDRRVLHSWLLNIGHRKAPERIAHLFCELICRMQRAGLAPRDSGWNLPLNQQDIADTLGLTNVHVNRVLGALRAERLVVARKGVILVRDPRPLQALAGFDPGYLSLTL